MDAGQDGDGRGLPARMRDGIASAVEAGGQLRGLAPPALVSFLVAAAFAPFLGPLIGHGLGGVAEGELGAALSQLGAVGGGYLTDVLTKASKRVSRGSPVPAGARTRDELAAAVQAALDAPGEAGAGLRAEVSDVLRRLDAVQVAMAADRDNVLTPGFMELGEQLSEFHWVLGDVRGRLDELRRTLARQGAHQRGQMRSVRASLETNTVLLQRVVAAQEQDRNPAAVPAASAIACPYPGLRPFESRDAKSFFGREDLTAHLVDRLVEQAGAGAPLVVLGPSGAGKSSLLRAGLMPALRDGLMPVASSASWPRILVDRPGAHPMTALALAMAGHVPAGTEPPLPPDGDPAAVAAELAARVLARRGRPGPADEQRAGGRLVVVADQFEEIFTQCRDEAQRLQFIRVLLALAQPPADGDAPAALVVLGLRADFYQDCAAIAELAALLPDNQLMVGPLAEPDLRRAITRPAAAVGVAVEPGLTELLIADLGIGPGRDTNEPGALPLLGYALQATWNRRTGAVLTVAGYQEAGRIDGAVAGEAERIFADLPPGTQAVTRRIMLRLVSVRPDLPEARRRVPRADLRHGLDGPAAETALARFTQARLVTADQDGVEFTHDAFLDAWPRLHEWIAEDRTGLQLHRQLGEDAGTWAAEGRDPSGLYRGVRLGNAGQWRSAGDNEADLTALEREFLDASTAADRAQQAAREGERRRERRQNRRLRGLAAGLAVVLAAALAAGGVAVSQRQQAVTQSEKTLSVSLATQAQSTVPTNLSTADLEALAGWQVSQNATSRSALLSSESNPFLGSFPEPAADTTTALAVSAGSRLMAVAEQPGVASAQAGVQLWDVAARRRLAAFPRIGAEVTTLAFSPDSRTLAAVALTGGNQLRFWDVATHRELPDPLQPSAAISTLAYSPDGRTLAVAEFRFTRADHTEATAPAEIDLWDLADHRLVRRLTGISGLISALSFSPDGRLLAAGGQNSTTQLWSIAAGTRRATLAGQTGVITAVAFSADGSRLLTVSSGGSDWVWQVASGVVTSRYTGGEPIPYPAVLAPGNQYLSVGGFLLGVGRFDLVNESAVTPVLGIQQSVTQLAAVPGGRFLVAAGGGGSLFALDAGRHVFYETATSSLTSLAGSGRLAVTGAVDGTVQLWDTGRPTTARVLTASHAQVADVGLSPDRKLVAAIGADCTARVWDAATGRRLATLAAPGGGTASQATASVAFSPDGRSLATYCPVGPPGGPEVSTLIMWDTATFRAGASYRVPVPRGTEAGLLAYDPDGRLIAVDDGSGTILLWDTARHEITGRIDTRQQNVLAVAFSPDGKLLATGGTGAEIRLWNVARRTQAGVIGPETSPVRDLAFSPGGGLLAAAGQNAVVQVWTVRDRSLLASLSMLAPQASTGGTPLSVNRVEFGPGGRTLISADNYGNAQVWDLSPADEVRALCRILSGRGFAGEWRALGSGVPDPCPPA